MAGGSSSDILGLTAQIVSAHVSNNLVGTDELPSLIAGVFHALNGTGGVSSAAPARRAVAPERALPAVPIAKSVFNAFVVCLECGKKQKMLKRHLMTSYGLSPEQYRAKWGLPPEYPMVAPEYAQKRSSLAKAIGLGTRPRDGRRV